MVNNKVYISFLNIYDFSIFLEDWKDKNDTSKDIPFLELYNWVKNNKNEFFTITMTTELGDRGINIYTDKGSNFCFTAYSKNSDFVKYYYKKLNQAKELFFN